MNQPFFKPMNRMALSSKTFFRSCRYLSINITKPARSIEKNHCLKFLSNGICRNNSIYGSMTLVQQIECVPLNNRQYSTQSNKHSEKVPLDHESGQQKQGLLQRFKQMYRDYWYVLVPVHLATSAVWFGSFYYAVRSGVDVISLLQSLGVSDSLVAPLRDSSAGYFALAFALYKIAAPLRYAVTIGGTTYAIKKFTLLGWIKPVPSKERIKEIIQEKRENLQDRLVESQNQMKEKRTNVMEGMKRYKSEMDSIRSKMKKM